MTQNRMTYQDTLTPHGAKPLVQKLSNDLQLTQKLVLRLGQVLARSNATGVTRGQTSQVLQTFLNKSCSLNKTCQDTSCDDTVLYGIFAATELVRFHSTMAAHMVYHMFAGQTYSCTRHESPYYALDHVSKLVIR